MPSNNKPNSIPTPKGGNSENSKIVGCNMPIQPTKPPMPKTTPPKK